MFLNRAKLVENKFNRNSLNLLISALNQQIKFTIRKIKKKEADIN